MSVTPLDLNTAIVENIKWPELTPLGESLPTVQPFDMRILPKMVARYASDIAERMGCPVDFPVVASVIAMATAIGSRITIKPYDKGTWYVPANLWGMCVSPPSAIKSPPILEALRPLKTKDRLAADKYAKDIRDYDILKGNYDSNVKKLVKTDPQGALALVPPNEPKMTRYIVNDSTYEMLIAIAAANPQGFLIWRDELIGWFHSLSKENQKEARGLYLTGWSGSDGYATDRIGRGHVRADMVCFSLLGTIQPNVLRTIVQDAVTGGAGDDGLMARFQLAVYPNPVTEWHKVDRQMDIVAATHYEDLLSRLVSLDPNAIGAKIALDGTAYLEFDDEAMAFFDQWREKLELRIRAANSEEHPAMLAHLGKYRSLVPKLALILHLADGGKGDINKKAILRALAFAIYLETHAKRIYHTATNKAQQCAIALSNKIKAGKLRNGFTRSDVLLKEWSSLRSADEVGTALTVLCELGWIKDIEDKGTGGRPAVHYYINPNVNVAA